MIVNSTVESFVARRNPKRARLRESPRVGVSAAKQQLVCNGLHNAVPPGVQQTHQIESDHSQPIPRLAGRAARGTSTVFLEMILELGPIPCTHDPALVGGNPGATTGGELVMRGTLDKSVAYRVTPLDLVRRKGRAHPSGSKNLKMSPK